MDEWTGPLQSPPFWLNEYREVTGPRWLVDRVTFLNVVLDTLLELGCHPLRMFDVAANAMQESGWGQGSRKAKPEDKGIRGFNIAGVKIKKSTARDPDGTPRPWSRALGHKQSGDPHTCFYRAWHSLSAALKEWLDTFVPPAPNTGRYGATGARYHAGLPWFGAIIDAGYKGEVTKADPADSIAALESISRSLRVMRAQTLLAVVVDGDWGPKSTAALKAWQSDHGITPSGELDDATSWALFVLKSGLSAFTP